MIDMTPIIRKAEALLKNHKPKKLKRLSCGGFDFIITIRVRPRKKK
jgi:hypothetical protein